MEEIEDKNTSRRSFLKKVGLGAGAVIVAGIAGDIIINKRFQKAGTGKKIKVLTPDGKLVEVNPDDLTEATPAPIDVNEKARMGLPGHKFAMVIDLSSCKNARKCVEACQEGHMLPKDHEWMKIYLLQDDKETARYWLPRPCFHCDKPMCVSVCPVGATYKREDGIVLVDSKRCIGCKFCMTGCPYSVRVFNWKDPEVKVPEGNVYDPELNIPAVEGTVGKCIFCADLLRKNQLPRCVQACPMGAIYFGDLYEDAVTNGSDTLQFSKLMADRSGYRYREELGTLPSVFYLPPVNRSVIVEKGLENQEDSIKDRYKNAGPR